MKRLKSWQKNLIFAAVVLAAAALLFVLYRANAPKAEPLVAVVDFGDGITETISLDEDHTYMRFLDIDQPIYNLSMDGLTNDDTDPLHWDSFFNFRINATDEANSRLNYFGTWQIAPESTRSQVISLDLTGNVGTMELTASGYSTAFAAFPVAVTFTGITANAPRPLQFSLLRCIAVFLALLAMRDRTVLDQLQGLIRKVLG